MITTKQDGIYTIQTGSKYDIDMDVKEVAKALRKDLKKEFGKEFKFSVRSKYLMIGCKLSITVKQMPITTNRHDLTEKIGAIVEEYRKTTSDVYTDYYDTNFYYDVDFNCFENYAVCLTGSDDPIIYLENIRNLWTVLKEDGENFRIERSEFHNNFCYMFNNFCWDDERAALMRIEEYFKKTGENSASFTIKEA